MLKLFYTKTTKEEQSLQARGLLAKAWQQWSSEPMPALERSESGKPYFAQVPFFFNLSHSGELAVCAVSDKPIGVDVEQLRDYPERLVERFFSAEEQAILSSPKDFFCLWTRKEAFVKYTGRGLSGLKECPCLRLADGETPFAGKRVFFRSIDLSEYIISICTESSEIPELTEMQNA